MKHLFLDLETTGLDPHKNGVIHLAGTVENRVRRDVIVEKFDITCNVYPDDVIEDEALERNGRTRKEIASFQPPHNAYLKFQEILGRAKRMYQINI